MTRIRLDPKDDVDIESFFANLTRVDGWFDLDEQDVIVVDTSYATLRLREIQASAELEAAC